MREGKGRKAGRGFYGPRAKGAKDSEAGGWDKVSIGESQGWRRAAQRKTAEGKEARSILRLEELTEEDSAEKKGQKEAKLGGGSRQVNGDSARGAGLGEGHFRNSSI